MEKFGVGFLLPQDIRKDVWGCCSGAFVTARGALVVYHCRGAGASWVQACFLGIWEDLLSKALFAFIWMFTKLLQERTPRKTNMSPENQWLEDVFPIEKSPFVFVWDMLVFGGVTCWVTTVTMTYYDYVFPSLPDSTPGWKHLVNTWVSLPIKVYSMGPGVFARQPMVPQDDWQDAWW